MKASLRTSAVAVLLVQFVGVTGCGPGEERGTPRPEGAGSEGEIGVVQGPLADGDVVRILPVHSSKCFDVAGISQDEEARITQWDCWNSDNQRFQAVWYSADDSWIFIAKHSGKCLDLSHAGVDNGTPLQQHSCHGGVAQRFRLEYIAAGGYRIRPVYVNKCLDVSGYSLSNGAQVHLWDCKLGDNQVFRFAAP